ncbi:hypothetical protein CCM_06034 [Cordyceps militaris CM01]|uniref:Uncharacterized protein n=1 Tax=Cordyceps militaris (strain CM01) TaxID=983644 RepID=G3JIC6_CORMM|nr:uncharacterized protein CCM_06034 [Cordyceps militaris CM01]EGX91876.1 hypothetical protein CCM_06034 [Cordyceps militaris CM01]
MISSRLQPRLLSFLRSHTAAQTTQRRLASSSSPSSAPRPPSKRRATNPPPASTPSSAAAAVLRARVNAEKEAPPAETAEAYKERYNGAARRWTLTMIALPILLVTSYYLFDRLALGHPVKVLNREVPKREE